MSAKQSKSDRTDRHPPSIESEEPDPETREKLDVMDADPYFDDVEDLRDVLPRSNERTTRQQTHSGHTDDDRSRSQEERTGAARSAEPADPAEHDSRDPAEHDTGSPDRASPDAADKC